MASTRRRLLGSLVVLAAAGAGLFWILSASRPLDAADLPDQAEFQRLRSAAPRRAWISEARPWDGSLPRTATGKPRRHRIIEALQSAKEPS